MQWTADQIDVTGELVQGGADHNKGGEQIEKRIDAVIEARNVESMTETMMELIRVMGNPFRADG